MKHMLWNNDLVLTPVERKPAGKGVEGSVPYCKKNKREGRGVGEGSLIPNLWDPDLDPFGSVVPVLKWLLWIGIRIGNKAYRSRSRTVKMKTKKENNQRFQVKKSIDHFAEGLSVFT